MIQRKYFPILKKGDRQKGNVMLKSDLITLLDCIGHCFRNDSCKYCRQTYPSFKVQCPTTTIVRNCREEIMDIVERLKLTEEDPAQGINIDELLSLLEEG